MDKLQGLMIPAREVPDGGWRPGDKAKMAPWGVRSCEACSAAWRLEPITRLCRWAGSHDRRAANRMRTRLRGPRQVHHNCAATDAHVDICGSDTIGVT